MIESPYKKLKGKIPTKAEFSKWTETEWLHFLRFIDFHIGHFKISANVNKDKYEITKDKIIDLKTYKQQSDHPWLEFIYRTEEEDIKMYHSRIKFLAIAGMKFLEIRPALITQDMRLLMQKNPNLMGKYLRVSPVVEAPQLPVEAPASTPVSKQVALLSDVMDVLQRFVDRAKTEDISELSLEKVLNAIPKLVDAINKMQGKANKIGNLTLINTNASVKDVEEQMLAMVGDKQNE